jgi:hypothetical protein
MFEENDALLDTLFIDRQELQSINQLGVSDIKVTKYIRQIDEWYKNDYKYGSCGNDRRRLNKIIEKLNTRLERHKMKIV